MNQTRRVVSGTVLAILGIFLLALLARLFVPMLHRSDRRTVAQSRSYFKEPVPQKRIVSMEARAPRNHAGVGGVAGGVPGGMLVQPEQKYVKTAELVLDVRSVDTAAIQIRQLVRDMHGTVLQERTWSPSEQTLQGSFEVRVPADQLDATMSRLRGVAVRVTNQQVATTDVTRQYTDNEGRMRSLQAQRQQYLAILKQAKSVKDVIEVTEKLDEVQGSIEQLQAAINQLSHDIAMSAIEISIWQSAPERGLFGAWRPLLNARHSFSSMVEGLADWADAMVSLLIFLPVIALWGATILALVWLGWKVVRFFWQHRPQPAVVP